MAINWLGGLNREYHHIKRITGADQVDYEPCMILFRDEVPGRSFAVPLSCLWKYLEPKDNADVRAMDKQEFDKLAGKILLNRHTAFLPEITADDSAAVILAEQINANTGIPLCTAYSLVKCCQVLDITASGQSLSQLLMFIQDGLDTLKNMPEHEAEEAISAGEVAVSVNGRTVHHEVMLSESDLLAGGV